VPCGGLAVKKITNEPTMAVQVRIFTIFITDGGLMQEELNRLLRGHKVLETESRLINTENL
jgi:hypothetical protein